MRRAAKAILLLLIVGMIAGGLLVWWAFDGPNHFSHEGDVVLFVSKGQTYPTVLDSLDKLGVLRSRWLFTLAARIHGGTTHIQIGKYVLTDGISNGDVLRMITEGKNAALISVTIPEGLMARQQARLFARTLGLDSARFVDLVRDESFAQSLGVTAHTLEGYLFPQTYNFYWQQNEEEVIRKLVGQFHQFYKDSLKNRADELGWTTNQVMTLASIVEGEAVKASERKTISGVYHNRLRKGMKLEADPTVRYLLEDGPRRIYYGDLKRDNPYNTYRVKGLPPGPINNPGGASIVAALYPERHNYVFFVANGQGGHWFTATYPEHLRYVRQYRRERNQRILQNLRVQSPGTR
jgi:UPF0755 protein